MWLATASQAAFEMSSTGRITTWLRTPTLPFSRRYPKSSLCSTPTTSHSSSCGYARSPLPRDPQAPCRPGPHTRSPPRPAHTPRPRSCALAAHHPAPPPRRSVVVHVHPNHRLTDRNVRGSYAHVVTPLVYQKLVHSRLPSTLSVLPYLFR